MLHSPPLFNLFRLIYSAVGCVENEATPFLTLFLRVIYVMERAKKEHTSSNLPACIHVQELRDVIAIKNAMFAEDQSDIQEFFLFILSELSKEFLSITPSNSLMREDEGGEWEEVGSQGRRMILNEAVMEGGIINTLFEIQLRKQV